MISENKLKQICEEYGIDAEKLINNNYNILSYGNAGEIYEVLEFLRVTLNIEGKNIEKCPSILYFAPENIRQNWRFLESNNIKTSNVERCLHVLSTEHSELKNTYEYILANYGEKYLNANTSILTVDINKIKELEKRLTDVKKKTILQAAISDFSVEECVEIVEACKKNNIEITGSVFMKSAEEIERIIEVCQKNNIEITGSVFMKSAEEIERIAEVCKKNNIEITGSVFTKDAEEIERIAEVCSKHGIEITGSIFIRNFNQLEENIEYISENFGKEYLTPLIISKSKKNLERVLPFLEEAGVLDVVLTSASILVLTKEEIEERMRYLQKHNKPIVVDRKKEKAFNSVFGLSRKKYKELLAKEMRTGNGIVK